MDTEKSLELDKLKRELIDADAKRDSKRKMTWFSLLGMLLYPICIMICEAASLTGTIVILGNIAGSYYVSVSAIVIAYFGSQYFEQKDK